MWVPLRIVWFGTVNHFRVLGRGICAQRSTGFPESVLRIFLLGLVLDCPHLSSTCLGQDVMDSRLEAGPSKVAAVHGRHGPADPL